MKVNVYLMSAITLFLSLKLLLELDIPQHMVPPNPDDSDSTCKLH